MYLWLLIILVLFVGLAVLLEFYRKWFISLQPFKAVADCPAVKFTVIVPARNEEVNIYECLQSILHQQYPSNMFEVIVADDFSTDNTPQIVKSLQLKYNNLQLLQMASLVGHQPLNSYKKKAIELAIQQASGEYIVTTDADCIVPKKWLINFCNIIKQKNAVFVAAPVKFIHTGTFVSRFQCLDFMSLQGITAASVYKGFHSMCNGANLAYSKKAFYEVNGFKGIDNIASGDDMLLMHKIYLRYTTGVHYMFSTESVVQTLPMPTWRQFFNQRIRWASKADKFDDKRIIAVLAFVYLLNFSFLIVAIAGFWWPVLWLLLLGMFVIKALIELRFMLPVAAFFGETKQLRWFLVMQPVHIAYTLAAGWLGKFGKYQWKGRVVK